jgi:hypothetical protein
LAASDIKPGRYRHFKGREYQVIGAAMDSESMRPMVVYRALYGDGGLWVRPLEMFMETIERDGVVQPRFRLIEALQE